MIKFYFLVGAFICLNFLLILINPQISGFLLFCITIINCYLIAEIIIEYMKKGGVL